MSDTSYQIHPETATEALQRFERKESVWCVELGGIGPGYEQTIWIGIFRLIKLYHEKGVREWEDVKNNKFKKSTNKILFSPLADLGLSGAQFSSIRAMAYSVMKFGWSNTI